MVDGDKMMNKMKQVDTKSKSTANSNSFAAVLLCSF